jgi:hypothetical protein
VDALGSLRGRLRIGAVDVEHHLAQQYTTISESGWRECARRVDDGWGVGRVYLIGAHKQHQVGALLVRLWNWTVALLPGFTRSAGPTAHCGRHWAHGWAYKGEEASLARWRGIAFGRRFLLVDEGLALFVLELAHVDVPEEQRELMTS